MPAPTTIHRSAAMRRPAIAATDRDAYLRVLRSHGRGEMGDGGLGAVLLANRPALLRFIAARGGGGDAEDLVQELWIKLGHAPPTGPIANPLAYLYRAADNMMQDRRRAALRRERREVAWSEAGASGGAADAPSAERTLIGRDELSRVERALAALGERTEAIFRRFRVDGVGQKAIAAEQGISLSAVEKHLQRAYRAIAALQASDKGEPAAAQAADRRGQADAG